MSDTCFLIATWILRLKIMEGSLINGQAVPYDLKYHQEWLRNNRKADYRNGHNARPHKCDTSTNVQNMPNPGNPPGSNPRGMPPYMTNPPNIVGTPPGNIAGQPRYIMGAGQPQYNMGGGMPQNNSGGGDMPQNSSGGNPQHNEEGRMPENRVGGLQNNSGGGDMPQNSTGGNQQHNEEGRMSENHMGGPPKQTGEGACNNAPPNFQYWLNNGGMPCQRDTSGPGQNREYEHNNFMIDFRFRFTPTMPLILLLVFLFVSWATIPLWSMWVM